MRRKARDQPAAWREFVDGAVALRADPPAPPAQGRGVHANVGLALPEPAFAFAITREPRYLEQARRWIAAVLAYEAWGYTYSKPDQDIPAGHLLYGLAFSYDLLHGDLAPEERERVRAKLIEKARLLYAAYVPKPGRRYSHSQNHTYINAAALGFAGVVLSGECADAANWLAFFRAVFDRVVRTYSPDGYYYEGYHYFEYGVPWIVHGLDVLERVTGERWFERIRLDLAKLYVAHSLLPGGLYFDFGDAGRGAADRLAGAMSVLGGHNVLYRLASRYRDPEAAAVADWAWRELRLPWREPLWTFVWREGEAAAGIDRIPLMQHFEDAGAVFFRTSWRKDATAIAFRCGPPEGHHVLGLLPAIPDWRLSTGHAHPDAGSFIVASNGRYLTGDAGYTGVKQTEHHNTLLIDGRGQDNDGRHEVFPQVPYARLDRIRILDAKRDGAGLRIVAEANAAYAPELGLARFVRELRYDGDRTLEISDRVETDTPRSVSFLLHADGEVRPQGGSAFWLSSGKDSAAGLRVEARQPKDLTPNVEPQWVVAQGRPGSVEKGEREQRGQRLELRAAPAMKREFQVTLTITEGSVRMPKRERSLLRPWWIHSAAGASWKTSADAKESASRNKGVEP